MIEEGSEETEEVEVASVIEGEEEDSGVADVINMNLRNCLSYLYFAVFNDNDDHDPRYKATSCEHFQIYKHYITLQ